MDFQWIWGWERMFQKTWYKFIAWFMATFYFFIMLGVVISIFGPNPNEEKTMKWMAGMMQAMHSSLMGWSMDNYLVSYQLLIKTSTLVIPAIFTGAVIGIILKVRGIKNEG